jgi:class 3 adenylate cyclase
MAPSDFGGLHPRRPQLVGRRLELSWLRSRFHAARDGYGHLVLLEGEAGIGKTRVAQEFLVELRDAGFTVVRGRCYEHLDLAYLPLRESLFTMLGDGVARRPEHRADLELLTAAGLFGESEPARGVELNEGDRTRQLLALTRLVITLARDTPTIVFIDDLDWADDATIDLLHHVLFRLEDERVPLLLLTTCRGDPQARAAGGVARLRSDARSSSLTVRPLSELEATELAREYLGRDEVEAVRELTVAAGGNPLLIEALTRRAPWPTLLGGSRQATHPMLAAIESRLEALDHNAYEVVRTAAFLVPDCTASLLTDVTGLDTATIDRAIHDATGEHILVEQGDRLAFAHPLYAHSIVDRTPTHERRALHARIAKTLLDRNDGNEVDVRAVAHHLVGAGRDADPAATAEYARRAGDEAMQIAAWSEAARNYEAALGALGSGATPGELAALHRAAGLSRRGTLELEDAVRHFDAALECLGPTADPIAMAELHMWRIRCGIGSQRLSEVVRDRAPLEALVDAIEPSDPGLAAEALVELSQSYWAEFDYPNAEAAAQRAMSIADRCGNHEAFARAATSLGVPQWARYELKESLETLESGRTRARLAHDPGTLAGGSSFRIPLVLTWLGRLDEAEQRALECCDAADRLRYPLEKGLPLSALAQISAARGDFDRVENHAHEAFLIQRLSGYHWAAALYVPAVFCSHAARGRLEAARDALDSWAELAGPFEVASIAFYTRYLDAIDGVVVPDRLPLPRIPRVPVLGAESWAAATIEIARLEGADADVRRAYDLVVAAEQRGGVVSSGFVALLARVRGVAEAMLGDQPTAVASLERAMAIADGLGAEPELARARVDLATIKLQQGERGAAIRMLDEALKTFERLGMEHDAERATQLGGATPRSAAGEARSTTAVILFTDVVESTRLTEEFGNARYRERARLIEDAITASIVANGGRIATGISLGDGFIGLFSTVDRAFAAARDCIRRAVPSGLHLHVALHGGEILIDGARVFGTAVNLAARICDLTGPDEILVSEMIRDALSANANYAFVDRGQHVLKGIAEPMTVFAFVEPAPAIAPVG